MKYEEIEKHLRDRLAGHEQPHARDEQLWERISGELEQRDERLFPVWWMGGLIVLLLIIGIGFYMVDSTPSSTIASTQEALPKTNSALLQKEEAAISNPTVSNHEIDAIQKSPRLITSSSETTLTSSNPIQPHPIQLPASVSTAEMGKTTATKNNHPLSSSIINQEKPLKEKTPLTSLEKSSSPLTPSSNNLSSSSLTTSGVSALSFTPLIPVKQIQPLAPQDSLPPFDLTSIQQATSSPAKRWNLQLTAGINRLTTNQLEADTASVTLHPLTGWSASLQLQRYLSGGWTLGSGLQYHQYWTKFEYEQSRRITDTLQNIVVRIEVDAVTGDSLGSIRGDATVDGIRNRYIKHYNSFRQLSLPIQLGYRWQKGSWQWGLSVGARINYLLKADGRLLNSNRRIVDIGEQGATFNKWHFSTQLQPSFSYHFQSGIGVLVQPEVNWSWTSWTKGSELKEWKPRQLSLRLGIVYEW